MPEPVTMIMGGLALAQTVAGGIQARKARKEFENAKAPDYTQSDAYKTAQSTANLAGRYAQEGLPERVMRFQEDMIGRSGAASLQSAGSLRQGVSGITGAATSLADQYRQLAAMDANAQLQQRGQYLNQLNAFQREQRFGFENEMADFVNQQAARLARMSGGMDMVNAGLGGMSKSLAMGIDSGKLTGNPGAKGVPKGVGTTNVGVPPKFPYSNWDGSMFDTSGFG